MRVRSVLLVAASAAALSLGLAACGSSGGGGGGDSATIYSSLPQQATDRPQTKDVIDGMKLALSANSKPADCTIKYVSLDDATAAAGQWDPGQTSSNARKEAQDDSTIAVLGEFNSGASAISIPITNEAGLLQVSPANTYVGLTRSQGAEKGEPEKYYPSGKRTYGRVIPADHVQAAADVAYMLALGSKKLYVLNDKEVYGKGVADLVAADAKAAGIEVLGNEGIDTKAANFRSLAGKIKAAGADSLFFGGITANKGPQVFNDVNAAIPDAKLYGPDGVAETTFTEALKPAAQKQAYITVATLSPDEYPPEGQAFFKDFKAKYGKEPEPYAIYGYESMAAVLAAIDRAGTCTDRDKVIKAFFATKDRKSVLGTYSIDKNGDTTLSDYGAYIVKDGKLVYKRRYTAKQVEDVLAKAGG